MKRPLPLRAPPSLPTDDTAVTDQFVTPAIVGNYRIEGVLGEGGMGTVFAARHRLLGREVAIKMLRSEHGGDGDDIVRLLDEARALAALRHPGIVEVLDGGVLADGRPYLVMERLRGRTVGDELRRRSFSEPEALAIARAAAEALATAHRHGLVHRDIKPDNLFLSDDDAHGAVKLLDFGVAALLGCPASQPGLVGTPMYMAPEQCRGEPVDPRSDLYGLGCVLFEMLAGTPPFAADNVALLLLAHLEQPPPLLGGVSPAVAALVADLLAKEPAARTPSARALIDRIDHLLRTLRTTAPISAARETEPGFRTLLRLAAAVFS